MTDFKTYRLSRSETIVMWICIIAAGLIISYLMYHSVVASVMIIPFAPWIKSMTENELCERRRRRYMTEFKDFLFILSTSIGAGRSMKDAVGEAVPALESIYGKNSVLPAELLKSYERMHVGGENDLTVLMDLAAASGLEDVYDFVTVYSICKTTGASLITALRRAAGVIMDKMTIEREIDELVRRKKTEGLFIFAMPAVVILFLNVFAPDYIAPLYVTLAGRIIMTVVLASSFGIYTMIQKIIRIDI